MQPIQWIITLIYWVTVPKCDEQNIQMQNDLTNNFTASACVCQIKWVFSNQITFWKITWNYWVTSQDVKNSLFYFTSNNTRKFTVQWPNLSAVKSDVNKFKRLKLKVWATDKVLNCLSNLAKFIPKCSTNTAVLNDNIYPFN